MFRRGKERCNFYLKKAQVVTGTRAGNQVGSTNQSSDVLHQERNRIVDSNLIPSKPAGRRRKVWYPDVNLSMTMLLLIECLLLTLRY